MSVPIESPYAASYMISVVTKVGVTLFHQKLTTFLDIVLSKVMTFISYRFVTNLALPAFQRRLPVLSIQAHWKARSRHPISLILTERFCYVLPLGRYERISTENRRFRSNGVS